jgi:Ser/Thr protein kinase RdoA (MazF antagonist)
VSGSRPARADALAGALAGAALAAYDVPAGATLAPVRCTNNAVYAVRTPATGAGRDPAYALRLHRPGYRSPAQTRSELAYVRALGQAAGVPVPAPLPTRTGELVVEVGVGGAARHADLLTWLPGRVRRPGAGLGPRSAARLGETLARIHAFSEGFVPPPGFRLPVRDADGLFTERSPFRPGPPSALFGPDERALFGRIEGATRRVLARLGRGGAAFGVVHGDYILGNCRFRGRTPGVLDFDDCGWGHFLYDLAPLLGNLSDSGRFPLLGRAFLAGYRRVRALPAAAEADLPVLMAARHAASCLWVAGLARLGSAAGANTVDASAHVAARVAEMRRCLALRVP